MRYRRAYELSPQLRHGDNASCLPDGVGIGGDISLYVAAFCVPHCERSSSSLRNAEYASMHYATGHHV
ncbi:MAG: hypothetical protein WCK94_14575 [Comamonadaceae bacterium]